MTKSGPTQKKFGRVFARNGLPLDPSFVFPKQETGKIDLIWECTMCELQEMEFNLSTYIKEFAPPGWKILPNPHAEEDDDEEHICPDCVKIGPRWI